MDFTGIVTHIGERETFTSANGKEFSRRSITLRNDDQQYPDTVVVSLKSEPAQSFSGTLGQRMTARFNFRAFQSKDGIWFNRLECWRID